MTDWRDIPMRMIALAEALADPNHVTSARRTIAARSTLETFMAAKEAA